MSDFWVGVATGVGSIMGIVFSVGGVLVLRFMWLEDCREQNEYIKNKLKGEDRNEQD